MAALNRFLIVLIVLLSCASAVLSYFLFQSRQELNERGETLARTVAEVAKALDQDEVTTVPDEVTFEKPVEGEPGQGTLSWESYRENTENYLDALARVQDLAEKTSELRQVLADTLESVALELGSDELLKEKLEGMQVESVESAGQRIVYLAKAVDEQRDDFKSVILKVQTELQKSDMNLLRSFDKNLLDERKIVRDEMGEDQKGGFKHENELQGLNEAFDKAMERLTAYKNTLETAISTIKVDWEKEGSRISASSISGSRYEQALETMEHVFADVNKEIDAFEETMEELKKLRAEEEALGENLQEVKSALNSKDDSLNHLRKEFEELQTKYNRLVKNVRSPDEETSKGEGVLGAGEGQPTAVDVSRDLVAEVLQVNDEWNFVVLNVGAKDAVSNDEEFIVTRGDDFVARVRVVRVAKDFCVADVKPVPDPQAVKEGDQAILPIEL
jgi:chromosome segregation ATPase